MRFSKQRETIKKVVKDTDAHFSAEQVYFEAKKMIPDISLGTVYRNLKQLADEKTIESLGDLGPKARYDGNTAPHPHFMCRICGGVTDLSNTGCDTGLIESRGYKVESQKVTLYGLCPVCVQNNNIKGE